MRKLRLQTTPNFNCTIEELKLKAQTMMKNLENILIVP